MTLAGIICVRNGIELDYCWIEAAASLMAFCDELVLCDGESTDGTKAIIDEWASKTPKVTPCTFPWTNPVGTSDWWPTFANYGRQHAKSDWVFMLDADEVLHEKSCDEVRAAVAKQTPLICQRLNFWKDPQHLIPHGHACGHEVIRLGPKDKWQPSDYPDGQGRDGWICANAVKSNVQIFHYGFLRKREAFFKKMREVHRIWTGGYDSRMEAAEKFEGNFYEMPGITGWENQLTEYTGNHPEIIKPWLRERNYDC